jgi:hypothetical protein
MRAGANEGEEKPQNVPFENDTSSFPVINIHELAQKPVHSFRRSEKTGMGAAASNDPSVVVMDFAPHRPSSPGTDLCGSERHALHAVLSLPYIIKVFNTQGPINLFVHENINGHSGAGFDDHVQNHIPKITIHNLRSRLADKRLCGKNFSQTHFPFLLRDLPQSLEKRSVVGKPGYMAKELAHRDILFFCA